jgi:tetratricopeptide (TPR) repeat protein
MRVLTAKNILVGLLLLSSGSGGAQDNRKQAMLACLAEDGPIESIVAGCTWLLESGDTLSLNMELSAYLNRAVALNRLGEHALAIEDIDQAIEIAPDISRLHQFRGVTYTELGKYKKSVRNHSKAIRLDKNNAEAYFYRGFSYSKMKDHRKAIADYNRAIDLQTDFLTAINNRGQSYLEMGDCENALIDFNASLELAPNSGLAHVNRAECRYALGEVEGALEDHRKSIELMEDNADAHNASCWTKGLLGDGEGALADCNEALRLEPGVAAFHDSRALAYYRLQQYDLALEDEMEAMAEPSWESHILRAAIYQQQGKVELAKADYRKAKRLQRDKSKLEQRIRVLGLDPDAW